MPNTELCAAIQAKTIRKVLIQLQIRLLTTKYVSRIQRLQTVTFRSTGRHLFKLSSSQPGCTALSGTCITILCLVRLLLGAVMM